MKESRIIKVISLIILPILIASLIVSILSFTQKQEYDEEEYFSSENFVYDYMNNIQMAMNELIYYNGSINESYLEGNMQIFHVPNNYCEIFNTKIKETYFLIIYNNKALTNVKITPDTDTIEEIKTFISKNEKTVNILNGKMQAQSEILQSEGMNHFDGRLSYYSTQYDGLIKYTTTTSEDFQIYTSYKEEFTGDLKEFYNILKEANKFAYINIPLSVIFSILIILYLLISVGYKKGVKGIYLNDFDKVPIEIIFFISIFIGSIPFIPLSAINNDYYAIISLIITSCIIIYVLSVIVLDTVIKRMKSKTLITTSIAGNIILFIIKQVKAIWKKIKNVIDGLIYSSTNVITRELSKLIITMCAGIFIIVLFQDSFITFILIGLLLIFTIYKWVRKAIDLGQIEQRLKEMYEGNNTHKLEQSNFMPEFANMVKYLNDISNGFENAIQDRIKSERLKAELITNVSHDIKTPLTSIINYVDLLKQENIENEKAREYIGILDNKSQRLKNLTEDLIEASKISTGNISLNLEKINIIELINQVTGEFSDRFDKKGLNTIINVKENEINIMADSRHMYRIVENLFSNISKYALENSRVYIDIMKQEKSVIIEIKNISKDKLNISAEELMQRFVRGDKSRTTEGSGLGISIAQNLTELQNGIFNLKLDGDLFKVRLEFNIV